MIGHDKYGITLIFLTGIVIINAFGLYALGNDVVSVIFLILVCESVGFGCGFLIGLRGKKDPDDTYQDLLNRKTIEQGVVPILFFVGSKILETYFEYVKQQIILVDLIQLEYWILSLCLFLATLTGLITVRHKIFLNSAEEIGEIQEDRAIQGEFEGEVSDRA